MKKLILLAIAVIFTACNTAEKNPAVFNVVVNKDNAAEISDKLKNDQTISTEQIEMVNRGVTRLAVAGNDTLIGLTLGKIYEYQKQFVKDQALIAIDENMTKVGLILNHQFKYVGLVPRQDTLDFIVYEITNTSDKDIKNITGVLQFYNGQNQLVKQYPLRADIGMKKGEVIKVGETKKIALPYVHDKDNVRDSIMRNTNKLRTIWQPRGILFADDTKISLNK